MSQNDHVPGIEKYIRPKVIAAAVASAVAPLLVGLLASVGVEVGVEPVAALVGAVALPVVTGLVGYAKREPIFDALLDYYRSGSESEPAER